MGQSLNISPVKGVFVPAWTWGQVRVVMRILIPRISLSLLAQAQAQEGRLTVLFVCPAAILRSGRKMAVTSPSPIAFLFLRLLCYAAILLSG